MPTTGSGDGEKFKRDARAAPRPRKFGVVRRLCRRTSSTYHACISAFCCPKKWTWCSMIGIVWALFSTSSTFTSSGPSTKAIDVFGRRDRDVVLHLLVRRHLGAGDDLVPFGLDLVDDLAKVRHGEPDVVDRRALACRLLAPA